MVDELPPAVLVTSPTRLDFGPVHVGATRTSTLQVMNTGGQAVALAPMVSAPFELAAGPLEIAAGASHALEVTFRPTSMAPTFGVLTLGTLEVPLSGSGLDAPACDGAGACVDARFDLQSSQCVVAPKPEGAACGSACLESASCRGGTCVGVAKTCDDHDACTVDACAEPTGCTHVPRACPAVTDPCRVPTCDAATGCGSEPAPDGTVCGIDDCRAASVSVCVAGQCVAKQRPAAGRCTNTWVPASVPPRASSAVAFDAARKKLIAFGGYNRAGALADTWEWSGSAWALRAPIASPPARFGHALAHDGLRQRVVLFGGTVNQAPDSDTWEWDGATWMKRTPALSPPARTEAAMAYDPVRRRTVLFGGEGTAGPLDDTWSFDGTTWRRDAASFPSASVRGAAMVFDGQELLLVVPGLAALETYGWRHGAWVKRTPATSPTPRTFPLLAHDADRQRVVLQGGFGAPDDVWEWDGTTWAERHPSVTPGQVRFSALGYDAANRQTVRFGGFGDRHLADTWAWNGVEWMRFPGADAPSARFGASMTFDTAMHELVLFGGFELTNACTRNDLWTWNGSTWSPRESMTAPSARSNAALAYDGTRQRAVLFGGGETTPVSSDSNETWEWDGFDWHAMAPTLSPPARQGHSLVFDAARRRTVLFGGIAQGTSVLNDTWEWNGSSWAQRAPTTSPSPRDGAASAWDDARGEVVLFGGQASAVLGDTWVWNGATWAAKPGAAPPARRGGAMAYDASLQRTLLFGGQGQSAKLGDTWAWNGTAWTQLHPAFSPSPRDGHVLAYDADRRAVLLFGGGSDETWLFVP